MGHRDLAQELLGQLKDFQAWRSGKADFDLLDYASCVATPDLLFAFLEVFCPTLLVHDGNYFLASHFKQDTYETWMKRLDDPVAVQRVVNHLHVSTLFQQQSVSDSVACEAARSIAACWSKAFFDKGLMAEAAGNSLEDAAVTLYSSR